MRHLVHVSIAFVAATLWAATATLITAALGWPLWAMPGVWIGIPFILVAAGLLLRGRR